jgi:hypothetical protein
MIPESYLSMNRTFLFEQLSLPMNRTRFSFERFSLTPALSRWERENDRPRFDRANDGSGSWSQCVRKKSKKGSQEPDRSALSIGRVDREFDLSGLMSAARLLKWKDLSGFAPITTLKMGKAKGAFPEHFRGTYCQFKRIFGRK